MKESYLTIAKQSIYIKGSKAYMVNFNMIKSTIDEWM